MKISLLVCSLFGALMIIAPAVQAQINPFGSSGARLQSRDIALMKAAAKKLYKARRPAVGKTARWYNSASGNSGVVRVDKIIANCITLRHRIKEEGRADRRVIFVRRCRNKSGHWELRF